MHLTMNIQVNNINFPEHQHQHQHTQHAIPHFNLHTQSINTRIVQPKFGFVSVGPTLPFVAGWVHTSPLGIIQGTLGRGAIYD
jgi:hypothetical protein